jgi:hypothetical protein
MWSGEDIRCVVRVGCVPRGTSLTPCVPTRDCPLPVPRGTNAPCGPRTTDHFVSRGTMERAERADLIISVSIVNELDGLSQSFQRSHAIWPFESAQINYSILGRDSVGSPTNNY